MNIDELVKEQRAKEETYDNERTDVRNRIAHLEQRLKDMKFPHWSDMLSQIMKEVNKITEPRGIVFKTSNYRTLGLDPGILVFQDYMHSKKQMYGNLKFEFYEALFYTYDRRRIAIHSVDDIIKIIDGFEKKHEEELDETLQKYGSWEEAKEAVFNKQLYYGMVPDSEQTEDYFIECVRRGIDLCSFPAGMMTYKILEEILKEGSNKFGLYVADSEHVRNLFDKRLFDLAFEHKENISDRFSPEKLKEFGFYQHENLMKRILKFPETILEIPLNMMREDYFIQLSKCKRSLEYFEWDKIKGWGLVSQPTAQLLCDITYRVFPYLPDKSKTHRMCKGAVKFDKNYMKHVPKKFLTPAGNLKRSGE